MFFVEKVVMKECINKITARLTVKQKQWLWFIILWIGGLAAVTLLGSLIKLIFLI